MNKMTRRSLVAAGAAAMTVRADTNAKPVLLGGTPVHKGGFPSWPRTSAVDEKNILSVLSSGKWYRGGGQYVDRFEQEYARLLGARYALATANGTSALMISLNALGVGPGDEVIVPPYTFVATINAVLSVYALPVFVDTDPATFQIDARKIEAAITARTAAIMPVHLGGSAADLDTTLEVARRRGIPVIEDACQAVLGEWRGKKLGTLGATGCFSFQVSKNLCSGEGGAVVAENEELFDRCYSFHGNGRPRKSAAGFSYVSNGVNLRMTEFQGALLLAQMTRLEEQQRTRDSNAQYLTSLLGEIPGIEPAKLHEGCTRGGWHLYMLRYRKERFAGLDRRTFLRALAAEGVPCSGGYVPLNKEPFLDRVLGSKTFARVVPANRLREWRERNQCPANDRLCEEAVWFSQTVLLGERRAMDEIAGAIRKIQAHAPELGRASG